MSEPVSSSGIFGKLAVVVLILAGPLVAFALGTQVVPLNRDDPHRDAVRRIMGCFLSSAVFAVVSLLLLHRFAPWAIPGSAEVALGLGMPGWAGTLSLLWILCVVGALPGWWIVAPFMRWFATRSEKDFGEIVHDGKELLKP